MLEYLQLEMEQFHQSILLLYFIEDSNVIFDLSDSSLSYTQSATSYPAFYFDFYKDQKFNEIYETSGLSTLLM